MPSRSREAAASTKKKRTSPLLWVILALVVVVGGYRMVTGYFPFQPRQSLDGQTVSGDTLSQLRTLAKDEPQAKYILKHLDDYPYDLLTLLGRNTETLDFVAGYPQHKDDTPADTVGEVTKGEFPLLMQWDMRWGYATYGDGLMALNGCGPTALSMVISGLTGDNTVTPYTVAQYADSQGYYVDGVGTSWDLMRAGAEHFGLTAKELPLDEGVITRALTKGQPIICSVGPGDFTSSGHFIVLVGMEDGKIRVNDPNRHSTSSQLWDYDTLAGQINNLWAYSLA